MRISPGTVATRRFVIGLFSVAKESSGCFRAAEPRSRRTTRIASITTSDGELDHLRSGVIVGHVSKMTSLDPGLGQAAAAAVDELC